MKRLRSAANILAVAAFFFGAILWVAYVWVTNRFETATLETIVLYLSLPLTGVDMRFIYSLSAQVACVVLATVAFALLLRRSSGGAKLFGLPAKYFGPLFLLVSAGLLCSSLYVIEERYQVREFLFPDGGMYTFFEENLEHVTAEDVSFPDRKNNVVLVILESVENTMLDPAVFNPVLMPKVRELATENTAFTGQRQCVGSEYSIASFQSLMLAVPFLTGVAERAARVIDGDLDSIFTKVKERDFTNTSLLGMFEKHGYKIKMFRCADARFTAYNDFMEMATSACEVYDFVYYRDRGDVSGPQNYWGLNDSFIYERAKEHMRSVYQDGPFFLFIQTVGTHAPGLYEPGMLRAYGDYRDSYVQADMLVDGFVRWIREQEFGPDTTIVLVGDHLNGFREIGPVSLPKPADRGILSVFINSLAEGGNVNRRRPFATWDLPPTIIEAAGGVVPDGKMGFGVSLYSKEKNLLEKYGFSHVNSMLKKRSKLYVDEFLW